MSGGILLIGSATDPEITYWKKVTRQDRLSARARHHLHYHDDAAFQLRRLADRVGLISQQARMSDVAAGEAILRVINNNQLSAVFLPDADQHLGNRTPLQIHLTPAFPAKSVSQAGFDFGRATRVERVVEMLRRTPRFLQGKIKQDFDNLLSSNSLLILATTLVSIAAGNLLGYGEVIEAALAAVAYAMAGWFGLSALRDIIAA